MCNRTRDPWLAEPNKIYVKGTLLIILNHIVGQKQSKLQPSSEAEAA